MTAMLSAPPTFVAPAAPPTPALAPAVMPEDLLGMEDDGLFELVDGHLVDKRMAIDANLVAAEINFQLKLHVRESRAGFVAGEQSFQCFPNRPDQVRRPDVFFILADRMPTPRPPGHMPVRPDIAVEVVSPNDNVYELQQKLDDYRSAGIPLVWVAYPNVRVVEQHTLDGPIVALRAGDMLGGGTVLPGFSVAVSDLFQQVPATAAA